MTWLWLTRWFLTAMLLFLLLLPIQAHLRPYVLVKIRRPQVSLTLRTYLTSQQGGLNKEKRVSKRKEKQIFWFPIALSLFIKILVRHNYESWTLTSHQHCRCLLLWWEIFFYYLFGLTLSHRFTALLMTGLKTRDLSCQNANNSRYPHKWRHQGGFYCWKENSG